MLTEEQKAELIKRYRNRHVDTKALGFTEADLAALIADVEQAARQEMIPVLNQARAQIVWLAFGERRSPGWDGPTPTAKQAVDAIDAARGQA
jgi:hypothetical protein